MKKYYLAFLLLLNACVTTTENMTDLNDNKVYKTICTDIYSASKCAAKTKEICPNQLKSAQGFWEYGSGRFAEVLFVCKDEIEVQQ